MNEEITYRVLQACADVGAREFVVCAGSRNSSFVEALRVEERANTYYWPEERSASFFALGLTRRTKRPVPVITTSGTASAELYPAAMEAYYSGVPLILITADRPRSFRGSGAPQSAEQEKLFGYYAKTTFDVADGDTIDLTSWDRQGPLHINVCLAEPQKQPKFQGRQLDLDKEVSPTSDVDMADAHSRLDRFFSTMRNPLAIASTLKAEDREAVVQLLTALGIPVMIDGISGLREDPRLRPLSLMRTDKILDDAAENGYPIGNILRIGGIPTHRIWRDLEYVSDDMNVCAISEMPYSGLSWTRNVIRGPISKILSGYRPPKVSVNTQAQVWLAKQRDINDRLQELFVEEPQAEPSLVRALSSIIPAKSHIYLGNSLPVREWDMSAQRDDRQWEVNASRGVCGIDGQISTFLGLCRPGVSNWGIFGDLTMLYDMAGFWILPKLDSEAINIVVINNGGGKIFERMYPYKEMLNLHQLKFKPLAEMWGLNYLRWENIPKLQMTGCNFIEIVPDEAATHRFWEKYAKLDEQATTESLSKMH